MRRLPIVVKNLDRPDEQRTFEKGSLRLLRLAGIELGRAEYEPGWKWSEHVAPVAGVPSCPVEHVGVVLQGQAAVKMDGGEEVVLTPGDVFYVPPGHDSWVVGDVPYVSLHLQGAGAYATRHAGPRRRVRKPAARKPSRPTALRGRGRRVAKAKPTPKPKSGKGRARRSR